MSAKSDSHPPAFNAYYDHEKKSYWILDGKDNWIQVGSNSLALHLEKAGFSRKVPKGGIMSPAEAEVVKIQMEKSVVYAGPLAGYAAGLLTQNEHKILVTTTPRVPREDIHGGDWPTLRQIFDTTLVDGEIDQRPYWYSLLKISHRSLVASLENPNGKTFVPAPALVMAGKSNSGKSLLRDIFCHILGGRMAHPHRYMNGLTSFNKELIGCETLAVDDETVSTDTRARRHFGSQIKTMIFAGSFSAHGKNRDAITVRPFWRILVLVNDEAENLCAAPPIDESLEDKIMLFRIMKGRFLIDADDEDGRALLWAAIEAEIPAFLFWLKYEFEIPEFAKGKRTGIKAFKHPALLEELSAISPEVRMYDLAREFIFAETQLEKWEGTAERFAKTLCDACPAAREILKFSSSAGTYLGRLLDRYPDMIQFTRTSSARKWTLLRPKDLPLPVPGSIRVV